MSKRQTVATPAGAGALVASIERADDFGSDDQEVALTALLEAQGLGWRFGDGDKVEVFALEGAPRENREVVRSYPIDQVWKRGGFYVARFTGPDPKYGAGREFLDGKAVKARKTLEFSEGSIGDLPAWVLRRPDDPCGSCGQIRKIRDTGEDLIAALPGGWIDYGRVFGTDDLLTVFNAGLPGTPGAWRGDRCGDCETSPVLEAGGTCGDCAEAAGNRPHLESLPDGEVF